MSFALYVTHPEVNLDPDEPPTRWHLSPRGRERAAAFGRSAAMRAIGLVIASPEVKTMETAELISAGARTVVAGDGTHENVRNGGVLPAARFEQMLDALYAEPEVSVGGWETLAATERRILAAVQAAVTQHGQSAPLAFVGHGTVGTLLKCRIAGRHPVRDEDQRRMADPGGGNVFAFSLPEMRLIADWTAMEAFSIASL